MENIKAVIYNLHIKPQLNLRISNITKSVEKSVYIILYVFYSILSGKSITIKKFSQNYKFCSFSI